MKIMTRIHSLIQENKSFALIIVTQANGSTPRKAGAKMIVFPDGSIEGSIGGGAIERRAYKEAIKVIKEGKPRFISFNLNDELAMACGGAMDIYIEPFYSRKRLIIFGAGHIGKELAPLGKKLGYEVFIVDERKDMNISERFPEIRNLKIMKPLQFIESFSFDETDSVVSLTHKHLHDRDIIHALIKVPLKYLGMIGSKRKVAQTFNYLKENGIDPELFKSVHAPIGFGIKAETPEEIAILIAAELIIG